MRFGSIPYGMKFERNFGPWLIAAASSLLFPSQRKDTELPNLSRAVRGGNMDAITPPAIPSLNDMKFASGAPGYRFVLGDLSGWYKSPVLYVEFRVYRRFGFAIWDYKRMESLGLLYQQPGGLLMLHDPRSELDLYVRWESFLSENDLEEIERRKEYLGMEVIRVELSW